MKKEIKKQIEKKEKKLIDFTWIFKVTIIAFTISFGLSALAETFIPNLNSVIAIFILIAFITLGILFDMVGVAVTTADEAPFHSMSSRKVRGAKMAVKLKKNADRVASFCNDVIGDVCGIISGSVGISISISISNALNANLFLVTLIVTAVVAALTISGKAMCKSIAINKSNEILYTFSNILTFKK